MGWQRFEFFSFLKAMSLLYGTQIFSIWILRDWILINFEGSLFVIALRMKCWLGNFQRGNMYVLWKFRTLYVHSTSLLMFEHFLQFLIHQNPFTPSLVQLSTVSLHEVFLSPNFELVPILRSAVALRPAKSRKFDRATRDIISNIIPAPLTNGKDWLKCSEWASRILQTQAVFEEKCQYFFSSR
jgi:hypothetical protein